MSKEEKNIKTAIPQDEPENAAKTEITEQAGAQTGAAENAAENAAQKIEAAGDFSSYDDQAEFSKEQEEREKKIKEDESLPPDPNAILEVRHLKKYFVLKKTLLGKPLSQLKAVDDVSFKIYPGETLGIVGESGCGKSTMGRAILKLHQPTAGQIFFKGENIADYNQKQMRPLRTQMQIVFQDPYSSLPPRSTVGDILSEPVKVHNLVPKEQIKEYVLELMEKCGLRDYYYERYPHEFSGGQRQRICIARALSVNPALVICDEPVSALDVSIQAQIINLLKNLQEERKLTYLFISHDLSVVKFISDKIGVMYLGSLVEFGTKDEIFNHPMHPYTHALFSAVPNPNPDEKTERVVLKGDIPSPANPPLGCKFHTRCPKAMEICKHIAPVYKEYEEGHFVACHCYPQE
ncbi:MAG: dipeptide ABC transporter ATP-binding protein [Candidatus Borkfalkiaceae bacterium]|nr:dipeptide ABC transporter ATP-binding protein [Clostridia bacterium]MDY6223553.1 dipeptide ABC transporter ATP-binding protein [Christensenellaceae bacterium]